MKSLQMKLLFWVLGTCAILLAGSFLVTGRLALDRLDQQTKLYLSALLDSKARELNEHLTQAITTVGDSRAMQEGMFAQNLRNPGFLQAVLLGWLKANDDIFAVWAEYEPGFWQVKGSEGTVDFGAWAHRGSGQAQIEDWAVEPADREADYYTNARDNAALAMTEPYQEDVSSAKLWLVSISQPVRDEAGKFVGVTGVDFQLAKLDELVAKLHIYQSGFACLVSAGGIVITHPDKNLIGKALGPALPGQREISVELHLSGMSKPWRLVAYVPESEIQAASTSLEATLVVLGLVFLVVLSLIIVLITRTLIRPLLAITRGFGYLLDGDFTHSIATKSQDELGGVARSMNVFSHEMSDMLLSLVNAAADLHTVGQEFVDSAEKTGQAVSGIIASFQDVEKHVGHQVDGVAAAGQGLEQLIGSFLKLRESISGLAVQVDASVNQVTAITQALSRNAQEARGASVMFADMVKSAQEGSARMTSMIDRIAAVQAQSDSLMETNEVISGIAKQTNLLSMNAAIEAAHAGDSGKGFAVVADEIRRLSENAAEQTQDIRAHLETVRDIIASLVDMGTQAGQAFDVVSDYVHQVDAYQNRSLAVLDEQDANGQKAAEELRETGRGMREVLENSAAMQESSQVIMRQNAQLTELTRSFGASFRAIIDQTRDIEMVIERDHVLGLRNQNLISTIDQAAKRFTIKRAESVEQLSEADEAAIEAIAIEEI